MYVVGEDYFQQFLQYFNITKQFNIAFYFNKSMLY